MSREHLHATLDKLLAKVEKPTRYLGGEWNSVHKDPSAVDVSTVLAFPDMYEIGMSHLGYRILYALLNDMPGVCAERVFMPWVDMRQALIDEDVPLTTLESRRPLGEFDMVGFSMQSELTITNVLGMLELGGIPLTTAERKDGEALVLGGGPVVLNPEPWSDFFDLILIGDAEEALPELVELYRRLKKAGATRLEILRAAARIEGWYAPSLYDVEPEPQLGMLIPRPKPGEDVPEKVKRRVIYDLDAFPFPEDVVVPHAAIVHDRVSWEIMRGCPVGCRFCQAGYIYRPTRERDPAKVADGIKRSIASTGYDEFSLSSLNTGEYGAVEPLMTGLMDELAPKKVSVGLGSMHASTMTESLANQLKRVRKGGFTIAPEAGSQRLRDVINKNLDETQILTATGHAFDAGWQLVKLYFMIGLPTETMEDVDEMVAVATRVLEQGRQKLGNRVKVTLSASTFVPKVWTPFQWFGMQAEPDFIAKQDRIRQTTPRGVQFRHHNHGESWLEGVLSRADRSLGAAILESYKRGALYDGWNELLKLDVWRQTFDDLGIDAHAWATRPLPLDAELPWEVVDALVHRRWLEGEYQASLDSATAVPCGTDTCTGCAPFAGECVKGSVAEHKWTDEFRPQPVRELPGFRATPTLETVDHAQEDPVPEPPVPSYRFRARFVKQGRSRFLGHLDLVRAINQSLRRAGVQLAYSQGFKPRPKVSLSPALALGISSRAEYIDFEVMQPLEPDAFLPAVNERLPEGIELKALIALAQPTSSLQDVIARASYRARVPGIDPARLRETAGEFLDSERWEIERVRKRRVKKIDIRPMVRELEVEDDGHVSFTLAMNSDGASARPADLLGAIAGADRAAEAEIERTELLAEVHGRLVSPLLVGRTARTA